MHNFSSARSEKHIRFGVMLALGTVVLVALVTWRSISRTVQDGQWVEHTMLVLDSVDNLEIQMTRRQVAGRMFRMNRDPKFLLEYKSFSAEVQGTLHTVGSLTTDNPRQQNQVREFNELLKQDEITPVGRRFPVGAGTAIAPVFTARLNAMRDEEYRLLNLRQIAQRTSIRTTYIVLTLLSLLLAAILGGTYLVSKRALEFRHRALDESAHLNAELERTNLALAQKRNEADQANKLKSQFLASMSHELRTPLNAISGFSELLSEELAGPLNDKQRRFLRHIREGSTHLLQLINDILDLSKIEAGETKLELTALNPAAIVDKVVAGVGSLVQKKSIQLQAKCAPGLSLQADERRLTQILYNLLSNAIEFTPADGHVRVDVLSDGDMVRFDVADTGPGITTEDQKIIFEEFRQAAPSTSGVKEGTGLGLAITKKLVERHGGRIEVESQPGSGSVFRFWLPSSVSSAAPGLPAAVPDRAVSATWTGEEVPLVLVVDDEPNAQELIRSVLESAGYRVVTADSSSSALQMAREFKPDLITLDLLMPGGNGFGTLYELRLIYQEVPPPVIIVSVVDDRATGFALGAADYLIKPVSKDDLLEVVRKHVPPADAGLLVVDDDPAMLELAREVFSKPSVRLYLAKSGEEGLTILNSESIDAIVLDLIMPQMDGLEFLNKVRGQKRLEHIPVSILTSKELSESEVQQLRSKADSIFSKSSEWKPGLIKQVAKSLRRTKVDGSPLT